MKCKEFKMHSRLGGGIIKRKTTNVFLLAVSVLFICLPFAAAAENPNIVNGGFNKDISKNMVSNNVNTNHDLNKVSPVKVSAKTVTKKVRHSRFPSKYLHGKGTGDCWVNSAVLYKQLKKSGKKVRIIQYRTSLSPRHRSVQICQNGRWVDYNYKGNGYAKLYYATKSKPGVHVIK